MYSVDNGSFRTRSRPWDSRHLCFQGSLAAFRRWDGTDVWFRHGCNPMVQIQCPSLSHRFTTPRLLQKSAPLCLSSSSGHEIKYTGISLPAAGPRTSFSLPPPLLLPLLLCGLWASLGQRGCISPRFFLSFSLSALPASPPTIPPPPLSQRTYSV